MSEEPRDSQLHATMSSLKATHVAHRVATEILSTPTKQLNEIIARKEDTYPSGIQVSQVQTVDEQERSRVPSVMRIISAALLLTFLCALLFMLFRPAIQSFVYRPPPTTMQRP